MWNQPCIDLTGHKYGRLTVIKFIERDKKRRLTLWLCRCECDKEITVPSNSLRTGNTTSCGCFQREIAGKLSFKHGMGTSREYASWEAMKQRCLNPNNAGYSDYGGRGITVCERWMEFENFYADMGPRPGKRSLDRENNNGNYEPTNCRWATPKQQVDNRRPYQISEEGRAQRVKNMLHARKFRKY